MALPVIALVGPTAAGKTALSIRLAYALGGPEKVEIVSADAMQLYRGMDIGTAKITAEERKNITHHQIDVIDISQAASVAAYQKHGRDNIAQIHAAGKIPLVVGGSGLYVSALLDELNFPGTDPRIRSELEDIAETRGLEPLIAELFDKDPVSARTINLANPRRVIRALEVVRLTGKSYTPVFPRHTSHYPNTIHLGVRTERNELDRRIAARAQNMFDTGLIDETRALLDQGLRESPTAHKATGYAQAIDVIDHKINVAQAVDAVAFHTRRLAKKQRTWFRPDPRVSWIDIEPQHLEHATDQALNVIEHARG
ncbi:tRNA (adenosine(37)-N6)-dimethylallyltransferase MiaA [Arcanobacterium pinnipediorum]|uniref:tRNA dimethylallyltransferase n=1 Tax=Arcanobacterium pinnipediorum TaxID=1503041 RepID=A0ABY5AJH4_9ACTO|nr:tRNA (adenosine(37)-N6)-dimethylallyltransferase MiaA [Arcanobacterium pinnipediorum]USR80010.1 tRNA (adenosine(37)-N6)-dimethylallyltransferase MiaA [Arcanobacterium pinnipediorum]